MTETSSWHDLLGQGHISEALASYRIQTEHDVDTEDALLSLRDIQLALRDKLYGKALRLLQDTKASPLIDWEMLKTQITTLQEAAKLLEHRKPEDTVQLLAGVDIPLLQGEAETLRGTTAIYMNDVRAAQTHFEQALIYDPKHYRAITNLGNLALENNRLDEAIASYEDALKINDGFANAHHNLGVAYRKKGMVAKSVQALKKAQSANNKQMREEAREAMRAGNQNLMKYVRWAIYGVIAIALYLILKARGVL